MKTWQWPPFLLLIMGITLWHGNATATAPDELPIRIVPQFRWVGNERTSPDGTFATSRVSPAYAKSNFVLLVDVQKKNLLWAIPLENPIDTAFSPDGHWLAACGEKQGLLLDLRSCKLQYITDFCGVLLQFSPDSSKVAVARCGYHQFPDGKNKGIFVFDLTGKELSHYPLWVGVTSVSTSPSSGPPLTSDFPMGVDAAADLRFSADGKTLELLGYEDLPRSGDGPPILVGRKITINLETHENKIKQDTINEKTRKAGDHQPPPDKTSFEQKTKQLFWNNTSGLCVLPVAGSPDGDCTKVWDVRVGRFVRTLRTKPSRDWCGNDITVGGFVRPDVVLASTWKNVRQWCSLIDLRTGEITPLFDNEDSKNTWCCPSGQYFAIGIPYIPDPSDSWRLKTRRLELHAVSSPNMPLYREDMNPADYGPMAWSHDGSYLFSTIQSKANIDVRIIRTADGKAEKISLSESAAKHVKKKDTYPCILCLDSDDANEQLAIGMGTSNAGWVTVVNLTDKKTETILDGFPYGVEAVRFVGPQRLLIATVHPGIQLWDIKNRRVLWTSKSPLPWQFGYIANGPYVVCSRTRMPGEVIDLRDGKTLRKTAVTADFGTAPSWIHPQLIADGTWALELVPETPLVHLVAVATGEVLLTFCSLPKDQWIVYTPDNRWDGSDRITDWVRFYRGPQPLTPSQIEALHSRAAIEATLHRVFGKQSVTQSSQPRSGTF